MEEEEKASNKLVQEGQRLEIGFKSLNQRAGLKLTYSEKDYKA